jgi:hypothetical protein
LNSGLWETGALLLEPCPQLVLIIFEIGSGFLPRLGGPQFYFTLSTVAGVTGVQYHTQLFP